MSPAAVNGLVLSFTASLALLLVVARPHVIRTPFAANEDGRPKRTDA
jgi:hypothetical protein